MNQSTNCGCGCGGANCGCCEGTERLTPVAIANRPGLAALSYRVGTHGAFLETMRADLSSRAELSGLTTRDSGDFSIALLDAWATVGDVLTFYQERIANEGYLRTALERRSVLELARLVGYQLRPGVAASVYFAYLLEKDQADVLIAPGNRAQSVPDPGEDAQTFETADPLQAVAALNILKPRLHRPQYLTLNDIIDDNLALNAAALRPTGIYLKGTATNLKANDALLLHFGDAREPVLFRAVEIATEPVVGAEPPVEMTRVTVRRADSALAKSAALEAAKAFPISPLLAAVRQIAAERADFRSFVARPNTVERAVRDRVLGTENQVGPLAQLQNLPPDISDAALSNLLERRILPALSDAQGTAGAESERLNAWLGSTIDRLQTLASGPKNGNQSPVVSALSALTKPPSLQPANRFQLDRNVAQIYQSGTDIVPRLFIALNPQVGATAYAALSNITATGNDKNVIKGLNQVDAMRVKAALFGHNAPPVAQFNRDLGEITGYSDPIDASPVDKEKQAFFPNIALDLDAQYDKIQPGSWIALENSTLTRATSGKISAVSYRRVGSVETISRIDFGISAKVTRLTLDEQWPDDNQIEIYRELNDRPIPNSTLARGTTVYAQGETLERAEEPLLADIGNVATIAANRRGNDFLELDALYRGLESGRWVIVQGERIDLKGVSGVIGGELVMLDEVIEKQATIPNGDSDLPDDTLHNFVRFATPLAYSYKRATVKIYGNVVRATHGETRFEILGGGDGSKTLQEFTLKQAPLTFVAAPTATGAQSTLEIRVNDVLWHEADNLALLGATDRAYIARTDDDGKTSIIFGTGEHGARLPSGAENVKAKYRSGIGRGGNVKAGQISQLLTQPLGVKSVNNPLAASGGADRESRDAARKNAPLGVTALGRLVSIRDYADFARTFAGIGKASAVRLSDGRRQLVHLTVAGENDIPIDRNSDLYRNLLEALQKQGDPFQPVQLDVRALVALVISARVQLQSDYLWELTEPKIRAAMLNAFSFEKRDLGEDALAATAIATIQNVAGVAAVELDVFDSIDEARLGQDDIGELKSKPRINVEFARRDPKPPHTITPAQLAFLTPDVRDTLILIGVDHL